MNIKSFFTISLVFLLLSMIYSSCGTQNYEATPQSLPQPTNTISVTPSNTPILPTETDSPAPVTSTPVITPTATSSCLRLNHVETLPDTIRIGKLLLYDRQDGKVFSRDLITGDRRGLSDAQWDQVYGAPDKKSFAYLIHLDGEKYQLAYSLYNDPEIKEFPLDLSLFGEWPTISGWINNNTVAFNISDHKPTTLLAIDLLSSQKKALAPDFPDINWLDGWSWGYWGRTLYSPDFHYVIFPRLKGTEPHRYILWDMQKQKEVNFLDAGHASYPPQWAPDGKKFAVAYLRSDFYVMDIDGVKKRLTDLEKAYPSYNLKIRLWSWSPDGQKISFWLDLLSDKKLIEERLIVLDTISLVLTDYCRLGDQVQISPGTLDYAPAPVWSPDGSALLIENREHEVRSELIVVDINQYLATQIGENLYPYDWLSK